MDEWESEAEEADFFSKDGFNSGDEYEHVDLRAAGPKKHPEERSPGFQNFRHGSDLGGTTIELGITFGFNAEEEAEEDGSQDRSTRRQTEEEEEEDKKQGQKKGALNRSRKSGKKKKKKEKEEGRKSLAGVISGSIQKLFGRSSNYEEKETVHGLQSNTTEAEKHRQSSEANDDDDDYDDDDNDDNEGSMWSDSEFDEEYDDEVYSNVDELGAKSEFETKIEKRETTTTTTTTKSSSSSAPTKATTTTTYDLITFEPENDEDEKRKLKEKRVKETFPDTGMKRPSAANSNGKVLADVQLSRGRDDSDSNMSKNIAHGPSSRVDKDRQDQEKDQIMPSIQSARRFFQVENNFKKPAGNELFKNKKEIQHFGPKNEAKSDSTHAKKCVIEKQDHLDFTKNKKTSSNDNISIMKQQGEEKPQTRKTTNKPTALPTGQTCVWSGATNPSNRFVSKKSPAADLQGTTAKGSRGAVGTEGSPSGGEETSDVNRSKIAAVHSLVKLFDTGAVRSRSPDLSNRTPRPAKDVLQQRPTGGDSRGELGIRESPALKKKPTVEAPKPLNSPRMFTATPTDCSAPPVLPKRGVNPGKRSPPTDSGFPGSRHPPGSRTAPSAPTDSAATVNCVHHHSTSDSSVSDGNRWKKPPAKALGQPLPPIPNASPKEPSKIRAKGTGNEAPSVVRRPITSPPPVPTKTLSTDIPNSGTTQSQRNANVNQLGDLRKNLRKTPETGYNTKHNEESLVDRSSKQPPSVPYKPPKLFTENGAVNGDVNGSKIDEKQMEERQLERQLWYFGDSTREECDARLSSVGQDGAFVVRRSRFGGEKCPYTLSAYLDQATISMSIRRRPDNTYALGTEKSDEIVYNDVMEIVSFHRINPIRLHNGRTLRLKTSPPK